MELAMYIGNDFIDAIPLGQSFIVFPGYVGHFVKLLRSKHEALILEYELEPEFLLVNIAIKKQEPVLSCSALGVFRELNLSELKLAI